jgi:hypothetical protein
MVVSTRFRLGVTILVAAFAAAVACSDSGGGSSGDGDDRPGTPDAGTAQNDFCGVCAPPNECCDLPTGSYCIAVQCVGAQCRCGVGPACGPDEACCGGAGDSCRNLKTDPLNCGMCGKQCGAEETCSDGKCSCGGQECGPGQTCCGGTCVDTTSDAANCGMCGKQCGGITSECEASQCSCPGVGGSACPTSSPNPLSKMINECCGENCVDKCNDVNNCGGCGKVCAAGLVCAQGGCFSFIPNTPGQTDPLPECNILSP